jgi:hypothetical protein
MTFEAGRLLDRLVTTGARAFEYGSGGSTLYLARRGVTVVSVEHDPEWHRKVRDAVGARDDVDLVLIEPRPPASDDELAFQSSSEAHAGMTFVDYVSAVDGHPDHSFDLLIVDGVARPQALRRAEPKVKVGGIVVLDDSERERYRDVMLAARAAGWIERGRYGPKPFSPWFARTTVWVKTRDLPPSPG